MIETFIVGNPASKIAAFQKASAVTAGDLAAGLQLRRTKVLENTARGVDYRGIPFKSYSTTPYTYYPHGVLGQTASRLSDEQKKAATKRLYRKLTTAVDKGRGIRMTRTGKGIHFPGGYDQFKTWLGRTNVDLRGPQAPHMLQELQVQVAGVGDAPAREGRLGFYGSKAHIAAAHQYGRRVPKRQPLGHTPQNVRELGENILWRVQARVKAVPGA